MKDTNENPELPIYDLFWQGQKLRRDDFTKQLSSLSDYCQSYDKVLGNDEISSIYLNYKFFLCNALKFVKNHAKEIMRKSVADYDYHKDNDYDEEFETFIEWLVKQTYKETDLGSVNKVDKKIENFEDAFKFIQQHMEEIKRKVIPQEIIEVKNNELRQKEQELNGKDKEISDLKEQVRLANGIDNVTKWTKRGVIVTGVMALITVVGIFVTHHDAVLDRQHKTIEQTAPQSQSEPITPESANIVVTKSL